MKRILSLFLVFVLILSTLASCNWFGGNGSETTTPTTNETDIQDAVKYLEDMYKNINGTALSDGYNLAAQVKVGKTIFTISWSADLDGVTFTNEDGYCKLHLPTVENDANYTLTATLTSPSGKTADVTFNVVLATTMGMISDPVAGKAYKLALKHGGLEGDPVVYFDGNNYNNYAWYFSYTEDIMAAVDVYLEEVENVEGGYRLYFEKDGVKTYIVGFPRDGDTTQGTLKFDTVVPSEYWTFSAEYKTLIYTSVSGEQFFMGSSGTFKSISSSPISYIENATNYPVHLFGAGGEDIVLPEEELPTIPENYTGKDVVEALYKLQPGQTLEGPYTITGVITSIKYAYDPAYGNISVNIVVDGMTDKPVLCYRITEDSFVCDGIEDLKIGDTITVYAGITNYNGTYETVQGGLLKAIVPGTGEDIGGGDDVGGGETADSAVLDLTTNANLVSGSGAQNVFAANGITFTNDKASSSNDLVVRESYSQRAYQGSTVKIEYPGMTKIVITLDDGEQNGKTYMAGFDGMTVEGATITRDYDVITIIFNAPTNVFQSGNLASQTRIEKIEVFTGEVEGGGDVGGGNEGGDDPVVTPAYTAPVAGQPYNFFMELPSGKVYFAGSINGNYLATTTDASKSVAIYFEEVTGGYHIFFMDGETKTYITAAAYLKDNGYAGCHFSLTTTTPTLAWTYNTTYGIIEIYDEISGKSDTFFAGTYGTFSTFSLSGQYYRDQIASGTQYPGRIELVEGGEVIPPSQGGDEGGQDTHEHNFVEGKCECGAEDSSYVPPVEGGDDEDDGLWTIPEVLASADGTDVVITGIVIIAEAWNTQFGNMTVTIKDANGNTLYVYRLATKVGLGDTITITGKVGSYNEAKQIAAGATAVIDVVHGDNHTYENGKCTVCESAQPVAGEETIKCDFSTLAVGTQYADETVTFGDYITVSTHNKGCHFNTQLRIYASDTNNGNAIITSTNVISSLVINAGYKAATLEVYGSVDGITWELIKNVTTTTSYANHTVDVDNTLGYKYIKLDATGAQVRVASIDVIIVK